MRPMHRHFRASPPRWAPILVLAVLVALPMPGIGSVRIGSSAPAGAPGMFPAGIIRVAPAYVPTAGVVAVGALPAGTPISVTVALASSDPSALASLIVLQSTPGTPEYRHFLSPSEVTDRFGPSPADYARALAYFRGFGLAVQSSPDRTLLVVEGPSASVGPAFGTSFLQYKSGTSVFYSHPTDARLPTGIPWAGVIGLGTERTIHPYAAPNSLGARALSYSAASGCSTSGAVLPCGAAKAYNLTGLFAGGANGTGYRIGIVDTYDGFEPQSQLAKDLANFSASYSLRVGNVSYAYPVPSTTNLNSTSTGWGVEEALDLEWSRAMAPGASLVMTLAPDATTGLYSSVDWLVAHHAVDAITMSWGEPDVGIYNAYNGPCAFACNASSDGSYTLLHPVLEAAAAEGISVFAASGDCGANGGTSGFSTGYPASDPYVVGVGGTNLAFNSTGGYGSESGWSGNPNGSNSPGCQNQGGSGGGFSPFPRPYWQSGPGFPAARKVRGEPDVSILAASPFAALVVGGTASFTGGTSLSSPMWAGIAADADSYAHSALGFLNPTLYGIFRNASHKSAFHDVSAGSNGYSAGTGWDPVTGIGTPNAGVLLPLLSRATLPPSSLLLQLTGSPRFGSTPLTVTMRAVASGGSGSFPLYAFDFGDGNSSRVANPVASHTYADPGVYVGRASVFDSSGNSTVATPIAIVVGGGGGLHVALNGTPTSPSVGTGVLFRTNVSGGTAPYRFRYDFGDGTYFQPTSTASVTHAYGAKGGYCALVIASDAASPPDGGASGPVPISVGGAPSLACPSSASLSVSLAPVVAALDLPGDFAFRWNITGGIPPYGATLTADDPYASTCHCGLFSTVGQHVVRATVADSLDSDQNATTNVTVYPALIGRFTASPQSLPAPLTVNFSAMLSGGHLANASTTNWSFGDGAQATGATASHLYASPGWYVATALATDAGHGVASESFLIDVLPGGTAGGPRVTATIDPAVDVGAGSVVHYSATVGGSGGPFLIRWTLGDNSSAFGANVSESYAFEGCAVAGTCRTSVGLEVRNASGGWLNLTLPFAPQELGNASALRLNESLRADNGTTPFGLLGMAKAVGMPAPRLAWAFGDGANGTGAFASHTYLTPGNYTVSVTATDAYGDRLVRLHAVEVRGVQRYSPLVMGGPNTTGGLAPLAVGFHVTASGGAGPPFRYNWSFGDGTTAQGPNAAHVYGTSGLYDAAVTVLDSVGDPALITYLIAVYGVTPVGLSLEGLPDSVVAGTSLAVLLLSNSTCGSDSLPGCGNGSLSARVSLVLAATPTAPPVLQVVLPVAPNGKVNLTLAAPATAGSYEVVVTVITHGYSGSIHEPFLVTMPKVVIPPSVHPHPGMNWYLIGSTVVIVAAAVATLALLVLRRRRRTRPPSTP
ncbi:MAG: PKD domain-containing protein [Thermoplasmata archaeon]|nr:PKD domain-containing protein [Thermoplasmata archaeon]